MSNLEKIDLSSELSVLSALNLGNVEIMKGALEEQIKFSKNLVILDPEDKKQIEIVQKAKTGYVTNRCTIARAFKSQRDQWTALSKDNIAQEKEILSVMAEEEGRLETMLEESKKLALVKRNKELLPIRQEELAKYDTIIDEAELLEMTDKEFSETLSKNKEVYLAKKEIELKEEKAKLEREKELQEAKRIATEEAEKKAKLDAIEADKKAKEALIQQEKESKEREEKIKRDAEIEKQKIIDDQKQKEKDAETAKIEAEKKVKEEQEKTDKNKKYKAWLAENNFEEKTMKVERKENVFYLWEMIATIKI